MQRRIILGALCALVMLLATASPGQVANRNQPAGPGFWGGMPVINRASTAAESSMRGIADTVRASGAAAMMNSAAARNVEAARSQHIDNRLKATQTDIQVRQLKREYRESRRGPRPTSEQLHRLAKEATPKPLSTNQYDPISGRIWWPTALMLEEFDAHREIIDDLFEEKADASGRLGLRQITTVHSTTRAMREVMRDHRNEIPPQLYSGSLTFLKQMDRAATVAGM